MANIERIKFITQKRVSLKSQITNLKNAFEQGRSDGQTLRLRINRVSELYRAYEELHDELAVIDPENPHLAEFVDIQEKYYDLAGKIESRLNTVLPASHTETSSIGSNTEDGRQRKQIKGRRIKLPEAALPTFDGSYENWFSFKNAFTSMIDSQTDLTNVEKFYYLKSYYYYYKI